MLTTPTSDPATPRTPGNVLVIGACGQLGLELTAALRQRYAPEAVVAADVRPPKNPDAAGRRPLRAARRARPAAPRSAGAAVPARCRFTTSPPCSRPPPKKTPLFAWS
ncbi:MAG: hypothetical protein WKG07_25120 [Hymenobacter sp.]